MQLNSLRGWKNNFRRWSTQLYLLLALLSVDQWYQLVQASIALLPIWEPVLPQWLYALAVTLAGLIGPVLRTMPQRGVQ